MMHVTDSFYSTESKLSVVVSEARQEKRGQCTFCTHG